MLTDQNAAGLQAAIDALPFAGHAALRMPCDVSDEAQAAAVVDRAVAEFG